MGSNIDRVDLLNESNSFVLDAAILLSTGKLENNDDEIAHFMVSYLEEQDTHLDKTQFDRDIEIAKGLANAYPTENLAEMYTSFDHLFHLLTPESLQAFATCSSVAFEKLLSDKRLIDGLLSTSPQTLSNIFSVASKKEELNTDNQFKLFSANKGLYTKIANVSLGARIKVFFEYLFVHRKFIIGKKATYLTKVAEKLDLAIQNPDAPSDLDNQELKIIAFHQKEFLKYFSEGQRNEIQRRINAPLAPNARPSPIKAAFEEKVPEAPEVANASPVITAAAPASPSPLTKLKRESRLAPSNLDESAVLQKKIESNESEVEKPLADKIAIVKPDVNLEADSPKETDVSGDNFNNKPNAFVQPPFGVNVIAADRIEILKNKLSDINFANQVFSNIEINELGVILNIQQYWQYFDQAQLERARNTYRKARVLNANLIQQPAAFKEHGPDTQEIVKDSVVLTAVAPASPSPRKHLNVIENASKEIFPQPENVSSGIPEPAPFVRAFILPNGKNSSLLECYKKSLFWRAVQEDKELLASLAKELSFFEDYEKKSIKFSNFIEDKVNDLAKAFNDYEVITDKNQPIYQLAIDVLTIASGFYTIANFLKRDGSLNRKLAKRIFEKMKTSCLSIVNNYNNGDLLSLTVKKDEAVFVSKKTIAKVENLVKHNLFSLFKDIYTRYIIGGLSLQLSDSNKKSFAVIFDLIHTFEYGLKSENNKNSFYNPSLQQNPMDDSGFVDIPLAKDPKLQQCALNDSGFVEEPLTKDSNAQQNDLDDSGFVEEPVKPT